MSLNERDNENKLNKVKQSVNEKEEEDSFCLLEIKAKIDA
jgi:hypothetical protein